VSRLLLLRKRIKWLLRDDFTDTRAAGSVNGTAATPGPGVRNVTDPDGDAISIHDGAVYIANPNPTWASLACDLGTVTREAGRLVVGTLRHTAGGHGPAFGWIKGRPVSNLGESEVLRLGSSGTQVLLGPALVVDVAATATTYYVAIVLRATGAYHFIRGGAFLTWTLVYITATVNEATYYPGIATYSATGFFDFNRVPDTLWNRMTRLPGPTPTAWAAPRRPGQSRKLSRRGHGSPSAATWISRQTR